MRDWLLKNAEIIVNCLDFLAFVLVTPDLIGIERLDRFRIWVRGLRPMALLSRVGTRHTMQLSILAALLAVAILVSGRYIGPSMEGANKVSGVIGVALRGLVGLWGGFLIFSFLPCLYTIVVVTLVLIAESLERAVGKWAIGGIMLVVGALVFATSRALAIWHAFNKG